jgi:hypothetical protein
MVFDKRGLGQTNEQQRHFSKSQWNVVSASGPWIGGEDKVKGGGGALGLYSTVRVGNKKPTQKTHPKKPKKNT